MNIFCRTITPQRVGELVKLAPQLKNFYLSDQPYLTSTWRSRETDLIFAAGCDLIVRGVVAANELPAHALYFGAAESKENWAAALAKKDNNVLFLWTKGTSLPNAIAAALRSRVASTEGVRTKKESPFRMVWPQTRVALLKAIEDGFTPANWSPILIPAIEAAEAVLPELDATQFERQAISEAYKRTLNALRARAAETTDTAKILAQLQNLPTTGSGTFPADNVPVWDSAAGQFKKPSNVSLSSLLFLGSGIAATVGIVYFAKKARSGNASR